MTSDTTRDMEFGMRLHDAYDAMGPSQEAQDRVLAALKQREHAQAKPDRKSPWLIILPLAACLALAAVVVRFNARTPDDSLHVDEAVLEMTAASEADKASDEMGEANASDAGEEELYDMNASMPVMADTSPADEVYVATQLSVRLLSELVASPLCP